jgi:hypothetical protein
MTHSVSNDRTDDNSTGFSLWWATEPADNGPDVPQLPAVGVRNADKPFLAAV